MPILNTSQSVKIDNSKTFEDILFSINPFELGVEIVTVLKFAIWLMMITVSHGELHESNNFLLRQTVYVN